MAKDPAHPDLEEFLFRLPEQRMSRDERLQRIKDAVRDQEGLTQEHLDRLLARLLESIQKDE